MSRYIGRLSLGNHKLPETTAIWNLPAGSTCPKATLLCSKVCYAKKGYVSGVMRVVSFRKKNYLLSQSDFFKEEMVENIKKVENRINALRIHESGDFYNQKYLDKWIWIARRFKDIIFYGYTKSYHLNFSRRPHNMIIKLSLDNTSPEEAWEHLGDFDGTSWLRIDGEVEPFSAYECPGSCKECDYCLTSKHDVVIDLHQ